MTSHYHLSVPHFCVVFYCRTQSVALITGASFFSLFSLSTTLITPLNPLHFFLKIIHDLHFTLLSNLSSHPNKLFRNSRQSWTLPPWNSLTWFLEHHSYLLDCSPSQSLYLAPPLYPISTWLIELHPISTCNFWVYTHSFGELYSLILPTFISGPELWTCTSNTWINISKCTISQTKPPVIHLHLLFIQSSPSQWMATPSFQLHRMRILEPSLTCLFSYNLCQISQKNKKQNSCPSVFKTPVGSSLQPHWVPC